MKQLICMMIVLSIVYIPATKEEAHNGYNSCYLKGDDVWMCEAILDEETREVTKFGIQP